MAFSIGKFNSPPSTNRPQFESSVDQFKQRILVQNRALAKKNSFLMTKISDLESKVSDLIQQNIELRALNAKSEDKKRRWFEEKLDVIEEGVNQRFEEMFQMFSTIRSNEGLPPSNVKALEHISNATRDTSSSDKTVSFQNVQSPKSAARSERRRKSLRRQSIYVVPPSPPALKEGDELEEERDFVAPPLSPEASNNIDNNDKQEEIHIHFSDNENPFDDRSIPPLQKQSPEENEEEQQQDVTLEETQEPHQDQVDGDLDELEIASTLSPIKFSSPRLEELKNTKFSVYEDSPEIQTSDFRAKIQKLASESVLPEQRDINVIDILSSELDDEVSDQQQPLLHDISKVKHTKSKRQKLRSSVDEQMPESINDELSTRKSRTRGKAISYVEPSLRAKMRRQSEKFVDAVVNDAFARRVSMFGFKAEHSQELPSEQLKQPIEPQESRIEQKEPSVKQNQLQEVPAIQDLKTTEQIMTDNEPFVEASRNSPIKAKSKPLIEQDSSNITRRRKPLSALNQNNNKIAKKDSKPMNKLHVEIDEAELSVFDLVEESAVGVPKTYKGKPDILAKKKNGRRHSMML